MRPARLLVVLLVCAPFAEAKDPVKDRVKELIGKLKSDNGRVRARAATDLRAMGAAAKSAAPALAKLLGDMYPMVTTEAVKALQAMEPYSIEPVAKMLKDRNGGARILAAGLLEGWGPKASGQLKLLLPALKDDLWSVRIAVARTIGTFGAPAVPGCLRVLASRDEWHRHAAAVALVAIGPPAFPGLTATLRGKNSYGRAGAAGAFGLCGAVAAPAVDDLVAATRDAVALVREQALLALGQISSRPEVSMAALLRAMGDKEPQVSRAAIEGAANFGPPGAPYLIAKFEVVGDPARPGAIEALSRSAAESFEPICEGFEAESPHTRVGCAQAIAGMDRLGQVELGPVAALLKDSVAHVQIAAARALAKRGKAAVLQTGALCAALKDKNPAVRFAAARAIGAVAQGGQTVTALDAAMKDSDGRVRIAAHHARVRICGGHDELLAAARKTMNDASAPADQRIASVQVCGELMHAAEAAIPDLIALRNETDPALRRAVVEALGSITAAHATGVTGRRKRYKKAPQATREAIEAGLAWLAKHQDTKAAGVNDADGRWDAALFVKHQADLVMEGAGQSIYNDGVTGLALSAFLSVGYLERGADQLYAANLREGLDRLMRIQMGDGCLSESKQSSHFMLIHGFATIAMCEAWILTGDARYGRCAQRALEFSCAARNPGLGWRYQPRGGENDTDVTTVLLHGVSLGAAGGLRVDPEAFVGAGRWIDAMTDPDFGQVGYNSCGGSCARPEGLQDEFPPEKSQSMTAAGLWSRMLVGREMVRQKMFGAGVDLCGEHLPSWGEGCTDMYYWYFGSLALAQIKGKVSTAWRKSLEEMFLLRQRKKHPPAYSGSWDPDGPWGPDGGRVYSTAINVLSMAAPYRYARGFWDSPKPTGAFGDALGALKSAAKDKDLDDDTRALADRWLVRILGK